MRQLKTDASLITLAFAAAALITYCCLIGLPKVSGQPQSQHQPQPLPQIPVATSYPHYIQSPVIGLNESMVQQPELAGGQQQQWVIGEQSGGGSREQRSRLKQVKVRPFGVTPKFESMGRNLNLVEALASANNNNIAAPSVTQQPAAASCLYDKSYLNKLDECLARKPYPTVGLPAFKNEDLLIKRGLSDRSGCSFVLSNGLFKNFQINKYSVDSDSQCLDGSRVGLTLGLNNITMSYLWQLRCLNRADQLLDDATLGGKSTEIAAAAAAKGSAQTGNVDASEQEPSICVGSSQSFGFASLQLSSIEAQVELATDIYKNWRVTNVTVAMTAPSGQLNSVGSSARSASLPTAHLSSSSDHNNHGHEATTEQPLPPLMATNIRDYVFETLDGDELNWRYLHLFQNWSRNRMHTNFLDQYRRFLWISLRRCLSETSERLPTKLIDVFVNQKYN